jgi:phosphatidylserine/phosphatidylglycerophosphate/cardiolipin synthase-like enzyme
MPNLLERADLALGTMVERTIISHHRRRLARFGWTHTLAADPGWWAEGDPPPRAGNALEILIDGAAALETMAREIRGARSHVNIAGWHITPGFALTRAGSPTTVRRLLAEVSTRAQVRVLMWAGAPLPVFRPSRKVARQVCAELSAGNAIQCALDAHERPLHCHHEKTIVVDDRVAFVGGIDLTSLDGDRWDTPEHQARGSSGWHDVAARIEGPAVRDIGLSFAMRWQAVTGETLLPPSPLSEEGQGGGIEVQIVRTIPDRMYRQLWNGDFRILEVYLRALRAARKLIYLENQFLWSPEIVAVLSDKLRNPPSPDFRVLLLLPERPSSGGDDTRGQLAALAQADNQAGRLLACTIHARGGPADYPIYVHAKVGIVDDSWLTIGSANLNEHSLFNDTEMNLVVTDPARVRNARHRLWAEHLERPIEAVSGDPTKVVDELWKPIAQEQAERRKKGEKRTHRLTLLPGVSPHSALLLGPLQGMLVDA